MPSSSFIKGTPLIDRVLRELHDRNLIEYLTPRRVPHGHMGELIKSADVVVDQLLSGSYGVAAVEAMAAGRIVVGSLAPDVSELMPETPKFLTANPSNFHEVMLSVLERRDELRGQAECNVDFVHRWHDGQEAAERFAPFLGVRQAS
ncbi:MULTISPECIES: glycosyltransferase [Tessaracoccus]|uniref:glycosyltransferase n=1 Tax=Tessaracoccus TaxID=72763 RepID=UPI0012946F93|nr:MULTISPECIES: glycosyltransferase [Tessaracoccus]